MGAGFQDSGRLAEDLVGAIAGGFGERAIDLDDDSFGIGDHGAFLRIEGYGGDAQFRLGPFAFGDIDAGGKQSDQFFVAVVNG